MKKKVPIHVALANRAERNGMLAIQLINFPKLLGKMNGRVNERVAHKADAYNREELRKLRAKYGALDETNSFEQARLREKEYDAKFGKTSDKPSPSGLDVKRKKPKVFGLAPTAIVRYMAANGYTKRECELLFKEKGVEVSPKTIDKQFSLGAKKKNVPTLSVHQVKSIEEVLD